MGVNKSFKRDVQILTKIRVNQNYIEGVVRNNGCSFTQQANGLFNNREAFDLCSFYMAQIGEKVKLLTDSTKDCLNKYFNLDILVYFRNMIDHDYDSVNRVILQSYIQQIISKEFVDAVEDRIKYCNSNKKNDI